MWIPHRQIIFTILEISVAVDINFNEVGGVQTDKKGSTGEACPIENAPIDRHYMASQ
ncbi:MAG: hypothetical protein ACRBCS_06390 [Cellvibrionaceae bacterium]